MFRWFKFVSRIEYEKQKALTQVWKDKFDSQLQAHQHTIQLKDRVYKQLKDQYENTVRELYELKKKDKANDTTSS